MMQWDRLTLGRMAKELGFPRDTHLPRLSVDIDWDYHRKNQQVYDGKRICTESEIKELSCTGFLCV